MSRRALLFQNLLSLFLLEVFMEFFKGFSHFLDFASLNNTKVISYNLCVWEIQETQQSDHIATQGLALLVTHRQECLPLRAYTSETDTQQSMLTTLAVLVNFTGCINTSAYSSFQPIQICLPAAFSHCSATLSLWSWQLLLCWDQQIKWIQPICQAQTALFLAQICPVDTHCFEKCVYRQRSF